MSESIATRNSEYNSFSNRQNARPSYKYCFNKEIILNMFKGFFISIRTTY